MAGFVSNMSLSRPSGSRCATSPWLVPPNGIEIAPGRRHVRPVLVALCLGSLLVGAVARGEDSAPGTPRVDGLVQADQGVEALLRQIEQQITIGHTIAPEGDNAMVTWHGLLEVVSPPSPAAQRALADFAAYARRRATEEQAAGRPVVASDLFVFAEQAIELLPHQSPAPAASSVIASPIVPAASVPDASSADIAATEARPTETPYGPAQSAALSAGYQNEIDRAISPPDGPTVAGDPVALAARDNETSGAVAVEASENAITQAQTPMPATASASAGGAVAAPENAITQAQTPLPATGSANASGVVALAAPENTSTQAKAPMPATGPANASNPVAIAAPENAITQAQAPMPATGSAGARASAALAIPNEEAMTGVPTTVDTAVASTITAPHSDVTVPTAQQQAAAEALAGRGDAMLAIKDIPAARSFYEHAANGGSARAALALAQTYDSTFLYQWGVVGPKPNPDLAAVWYRRAAALGDRAATVRLRTLQAAATK